MDAAAHEMDVRRRQLQAWISARYKSTRAFCLAHGLNTSEISQLLRTKSFGSRRARNLEEKVGMPFRYLEGGPSVTGPAPAHRGQQTVAQPWPFKIAAYEDFMLLSPDKRRELDIRVAEFIAGAVQKKRTA